MFTNLSIQKEKKGNTLNTFRYYWSNSAHKMEFGLGAVGICVQSCKSRVIRLRLDSPNFKNNLNRNKENSKEGLPRRGDQSRQKQRVHQRRLQRKQESQAYQPSKFYKLQ